MAPNLNNGRLPVGMGWAMTRADQDRSPIGYPSVEGETVTNGEIHGQSSKKGMSAWRKCMLDREENPWRELCPH